jgi:hypothetical protein
MKANIRTYSTLALLCSLSLFFLTTKVKTFDPDAPNYGHSFLTRSVAGGGFTYFGKMIPPFAANTASRVQGLNTATNTAIPGHPFPIFCGNIEVLMASRRQGAAVYLI